MNPSPAQVRKARTDAGLTQKQAANLICVTIDTWKNYEHGRRTMHPAFWELFNLKRKQQ